MERLMNPELVKMADGVYLAGTHGTFKVGLWFLESEGECAIMEMPAPNSEGLTPAQLARKIVDEKGWKCKYLLLSHPHIDHDATIREFKELFPEAEFPAHYSSPMFLRITKRFWDEGRDGGRDPEFEGSWKNIEGKDDPNWYLSFFSIFVKDEVFALKLGCETIYMIYGPGHSLGDMHYIYRGCWFSGDWWLYEGDPAEDRLASSKSLHTLNLLRDFAIAKDYRIHTVFPAHANNIIRDIDFFDIIDRTEAYHKKLAEERKENGEADWSEFDIRLLYYWLFTYREDKSKEEAEAKKAQEAKQVPSAKPENTQQKRLSPKARKNKKHRK